MEKLKCNLLVLRHIAFFRPHAHIAFLFHAPYREMYANKGQDIELCEEHYGQWIYCAENKEEYWFEKVYMIMKYNEAIAYHPEHTAIAVDSDNGNILLLRGLGDICNTQWQICKKDNCRHLHLNRYMSAVKHITKYENNHAKYKTKIDAIRKRAVLRWNKYIMH